MFTKWIIEQPELASTLMALGVVLGLLTFIGVCWLLASANERESKESRNWRLNTGSKPDYWT